MVVCDVNARNENSSLCHMCSHPTGTDIFLVYHESIGWICYD